MLGDGKMRRTQAGVSVLGCVRACAVCPAVRPQMGFGWEGGRCQKQKDW